jgi:hypothetical protein
MSRSLSRRIVLLLDCCYSGAFGRGMRPRGDDSVQMLEQVRQATPKQTPNKLIQMEGGLIIADSVRGGRPAVDKLPLEATIVGVSPWRPSARSQAALSRHLRTPKFSCARRRFSRFSLSCCCVCRCCLACGSSRPRASGPSIGCSTTRASTRRDDASPNGHRGCIGWIDHWICSQFSSAMEVATRCGQNGGVRRRWSAWGRNIAE